MKVAILQGFTKPSTSPSSACQEYNVEIFRPSAGHPSSPSRFMLDLKKKKRTMFLNEEAAIHPVYFLKILPYMVLAIKVSSTSFQRLAKDFPLNLLCCKILL